MVRLVRSEGSSGRIERRRSSRSRIGGRRTEDPTSRASLVTWESGRERGRVGEREGGRRRRRRGREGRGGEEEKEEERKRGGKGGGEEERESGSNSYL